MRTSSRRAPRLSKSKLREIRRRQARKTRRAKRKIQQHLSVLPDSIRSFLAFFSPAFTRPTFARVALLALAILLTVGCRTVSNLLRTLGPLAPGHPSSFHRVFSHRRWHPWALSRLLLAWILSRFVPIGPVHLVADDTVTEHPGDKVYGKACHRDAVRSSHSFTAYLWGHKWLVLAIQVYLPGFNRPWSLPFCVALLRSKKDDETHGRRHKTPAQVLAQMLLLVRRWFPDRDFVVAADGGYASHELAKACVKARRISLVSRFYPNAGLYEPPPVVKLTASGKKPNGRPRGKGKKRAAPEQVVANTPEKDRTRMRVAWYGGGERLVEVVQGRGHWYKSGQGLVEVVWVYVKDRTASHRDEYFFSTDVTMTAKTVIETYVRRWNLETTFQEVRSQLGLQSTRGWKKETVSRAEPLLFGMYSVVVCLYALMPKEYARRGVDWEGKEGITFSDALKGVRKWLWREWVFPAAGYKQAFENLPEGFQTMLLDGLTPAP